MSGPYKFRTTNRVCPECGERLEAKSGPDFVSVYRCPECAWIRAYDTYERPELDWYDQ